MIKSIKFVQYKKLKKISLFLNAGLNAISGENGTCKSSLLYLISNSFQAVSKKCEWVHDTKALGVLSAINESVNPKIESLQRGDKEYNDPAHGIPGSLYTVSYYNHDSLEFRRHNSRGKDKSRYSLKPYYSSVTKESLPFCPVVYLGLSRLVPYGEFRNNDAVLKINKSLPEIVKAGIAENFKEFTNFDISHESLQQMGDVKTRTEFTTESQGVDSNTISAGEDNLYIILSALESLKFYYDSIDSSNSIESVLLIDEIDATLHPDYQLRLLKLLRDYAVNYKIQVVFTTHSLSVLEYLLSQKDNVIYLIDNITDVTVMENVTIQQIKAHLLNQTEDDIYRDKTIPILTEDAEARFLINLLFDYFEKKKAQFRNVRRFFTIPDINIGADILRSLFKDEKLVKAHLGAFVVLDGDKSTNLRDCIIALPGKNYFKNGQLSPEALLFEFAQYLFDSDDVFWKNSEVIKKNFSKRFYQEKILKKIEKFNRKIDSGTTKKERRDFNKKLFNDNLLFFEYIFKRWLHEEKNQPAIEKFYKEIGIMFKRCADLRGINPTEWSDSI